MSKLGEVFSSTKCGLLANNNHFQNFYIKKFYLGQKIETQVSIMLHGVDFCSS